jgi:hypothetical protein
MNTRGRLYCVVVGGLAFWLPAIVLYAVFHQRVSILWINILSVLGLAALVIFDRIYGGWAIRWNWALAGVYIFGPISILTEGLLSGATPPWEGGQRLLFDVLVCLLPPMTVWLSLLSGQIFSVLAVTIALPLIEIWRCRHRYRSAAARATV